MPDDDPVASGPVLFALFNEIGILNQLAGAMFEARLPPGFTVSQFAVLNHLIRVRDGRTPLDLARAFQVAKSSMTHSLAVLERHGLIRFDVNPGDGRSKCVWITEAGRSFRERAIAGLAPDFDRIAREVDVEALSPVLPPLTELRRILDRMRDGL